MGSETHMSVTLTRELEWPTLIKVREAKGYEKKRGLRTQCKVDMDMDKVFSIERDQTNAHTVPMAFGE